MTFYTHDPDVINYKWSLTEDSANGLCLSFQQTVYVHSASGSADRALILSIFNIIFCNPIAGVIALIFAVLVRPIHSHFPQNEYCL